jgi:large subunit ribosomal protein L24
MKEQVKKHIKVGDKIKVISGSNKGVIGNVLSILEKNSIVTIEGISSRIKYLKTNQNEEAKKVELALGIHISNVMLWDKEKNKSGRIGYKIVDGKKVRYFKQNNINMKTIFCFNSKITFKVRHIKYQNLKQ